MKYYLLISYLILKIAHADASPAFVTRLTNHLSMSAYACQGHEYTTSFQCLPDEWMLTIDNINSCSDGFCTDYEVDPITVRLEKISSDSVENDFYKIVPTMPTSPEYRWILRRYMVHGILSGQVEVILKGEVQI